MSTDPREALQRALALPAAERPALPPPPKACGCGMCKLLARLRDVQGAPVESFLIEALEQALAFCRTGQKGACGFAYVVTVAIQPEHRPGVISTVVTNRELPLAELAVGTAEALSKALRKAGGAQ